MNSQKKYLFKRKLNNMLYKKHIASPESSSKSAAKSKKHSNGFGVKKNGKSKVFKRKLQNVLLNGLKSHRKSDI